MKQKIYDTWEKFRRAFYSSSGGGQMAFTMDSGMLNEQRKQAAKHAFDIRQPEIDDLRAEIQILKIERDINTNAWNNLHRKLAEANERIVEFEGYKKSHLKVVEDLQAKIKELEEKINI